MRRHDPTRPDLTRCDRCRVSAAYHFFPPACAGFVPPPKGVVGRLLDEAVGRALFVVGRLFYRYPEGGA